MTINLLDTKEKVVIGLFDTKEKVVIERIKEVKIHYVSFSDMQYMKFEMLFAIHYFHHKISFKLHVLSLMFLQC